MEAEEETVAAEEQGEKPRGCLRWLLPAVLLLAGALWVIETPQSLCGPRPAWASALFEVRNTLQSYRREHDGRTPGTFAQLQSAMPPGVAAQVERNLRGESRYVLIPQDAPVKVHEQRLLLMARSPGDEGDLNGQPGRRVILEEAATVNLVVRRETEEVLQAEFARQGKNLADWTTRVPRLPGRDRLPGWLADAWQGWALLLLGVALAVKNALPVKMRRNGCRSQVAEASSC